MGLNPLLLAALAAAPLAAKDIYVCGPTNAIPPLTQDIRALHLRDVGAARVYALHFPAGLRELNLSSNALLALPDGLVPQGVARLWLADNRLTALPKTASDWTNLEYLNLDRNLLAALPDLSRTRLTALPRDLSAWRTLKLLNLAGCPLPDAEKDRIEAAFDPDKTTILF